MQLQNRLNLRLGQKQILTPGLVQMVSVLALNKLELKDMIAAEMVENPVLEELEQQVPMLDQIGAREAARERAESADQEIQSADKKDSFDEIDYGSFFRDYLDPGHRTGNFNLDDPDKPSFENFLTRPTNLTDHLLWQLGSISMEDEIREAAERIIGNLDEDGRLSASENELMGWSIPVVAEPAVIVVGQAEPESGESLSCTLIPNEEDLAAVIPESTTETQHALHLITSTHEPGSPLVVDPEAITSHGKLITKEVIEQAMLVVRSLDPIGVAARDLRECLLLQLNHYQALAVQGHKSSNGKINGDAQNLQLMQDASAVVDKHLSSLRTKQYREIARAIQRPLECVVASVEFIQKLDPMPGASYNAKEPKLIEPDVFFVKHREEWVVLMNEDDLPQLRLSPTYVHLLENEDPEKDVKNYLKERCKSALQLIRNIEQRKQTIVKVCHLIIERQQGYLEYGPDHLMPLMIKEVAEIIGVHPSTVSRAVANKYAHTPQGVVELRRFFSESVNGPEGGGLSLQSLKLRVKKLIEEEDPLKPLTDDQITAVLQSQGIQVTRRTVAKYREDMRIPSTHQRRVKK